MFHLLDKHSSLVWGSNQRGRRVAGGSFSTRSSCSRGGSKSFYHWARLTREPRTSLKIWYAARSKFGQPGNVLGLRAPDPPFSPLCSAFIWMWIWSLSALTVTSRDGHTQAKLRCVTAICRLLCPPTRPGPQAGAGFSFLATLLNEYCSLLLNCPPVRRQLRSLPSDCPQFEGRGVWFARP